jgi:ABC-2 type transport system permease protein
VVDVASLGLWEQIGLVSGLRWRIFRNELRKKSRRLDLLAMIWVGVFGTAAILGCSGFFFWAARTALTSGHSGRLGLLFWIIFVVWQVLPILMAGFGNTLEFRKLLRFPLTLRAFYLISLGYGFADFAAVASVCWLLSMTAGAATAVPALLPRILPVVAVFIGINVTLERLASSWLERLLARRRTRELLLGLVIVAGVSLQFIQPLITHYRGVSPPLVARFLPYFSLLPPSLAGKALEVGIGHSLAWFFPAFAGLFVYLFLFSVLLWMRYAMQYRGEELGESAAPARTARRSLFMSGASRSLWSHIPKQTGAVIEKEFRYLTRNNFMLISLLMLPLMALLFSSQFGGSHPWSTTRGLSPDIFFPSLIGYVFLTMMTPAFNSLGYEGRGIQTYFTAPLKFRNLLLGKNFVQGIVLFSELLVCILILTRTIGVPSLPILAAILFAVAFAAPGQLTIGNWSSLMFPRKLEFDSMRGQRAGGVSIWVALGAQVVLGGICSFIFLLGRWTGNPWLPAEAFAGLAVASIGGYFASLDALGELAEEKKETLIEALCR